MYKIAITIFALVVVAFFGMTHAAGTNSICDRYSNSTTFPNNTALMTAFVGTAFGRLLDQDITAPYFTGQIGRDQFNNSIDYTKNTSAYNLLAYELVAFFGRALGCSDKGFPVYNGTEDQKVVHKNNMIDRDAFEVFNQQLVNIAQVLGFAHADYDALGQVLEGFRSDICTGANCNTGPHTIFVGSGGNFYTPSNSYTFPTGSTITFVWTSNATTHSVTQGSTYGGCTPLSGGFDSGSKAGPFNFTQTFNNPGSFYYYCKVGSHCAGGMYGGFNITGNPVNSTTTDATTATTATTASSTTGSSTTGSSTTGSSTTGSSTTGSTTVVSTTGTTRVATTATTATTRVTTTTGGNSGASTFSVVVALFVLVAALLF